MISQDSFISIQVALTDVSALTKYLIEQKVSFRMDFQPKKIVESPSIPVQTISKQSNKDGEDKFVSRNSEKIKIVRTIYEKYLVQEIGNIPPPESEITKIYGIGIVAFKTIFKKIYGRTFYHYYMERKMEYAAQLLKEGLTANEVATKVGYTHSIKFNKMFQKYVGITPKKYQMQHYGSRNRRIRKV